jgi:hypothetical protein
MNRGKKMKNSKDNKSSLWALLMMINRKLMVDARFFDSFLFILHRVII